ncbi:serine/threonine-protein kinase unc-51-like isoform X1 [Tigriopus californicus]|uniref:serine/threonine-protein kinase unc-51-like isoform X1 n=1 Tax=Tigriopus californicus TaxID=6832 RepID=UPI0027D9FBED|nr:serine/threonine-protein kinase unc-51-like isoform X1 [Tigriopus californicus]
MESLGLYEYSSKDLIGHGAFAVVYKGRFRGRPNQPVAIKAITKKNLNKSQNLLSKEIKILKELTELHHDNVVALLDCKETTQHVYLVMEYCNGGDLADYLAVKGTLSEDTIRLFLVQLAGAIKALVSKEIVHRDLKPQNILLHHDGRKNPAPQDIKLKIADFGFARFLQDGVMAATLCGSPMYMAPEVIMSLQYNSKADLWSLGTIVFQCLTGKAPFQAQTPQALKQFYEKNANLAPKIPPGTSKDLRDLLVGLLKRNAKDRFEFDVFFNHPFLRRVQENSGPKPITTRSPATRPVAVPPPTRSSSSTPKNSIPTSCGSAQSPGASGMLPPSPAVRTGMISSPRGSLPRYMDAYEAQRLTEVKPESSPDNQEPDDFVMVPDHLTMDAVEHRKSGGPQQGGAGYSPGMRRHTVSGAPRPVSLAVQQSEPIPVPSQKAAYQQMQQSSMTRSRSKSGDSVSAMSGVSSASGGSTLGPLPEDEEAPGKGGLAQASPSVVRRHRASSVSSPTSSPKSPGGKSIKTRRISAPPIPDICQMSPPPVQYTMGTPPLGHRRRTSSSSSCGGASPPNVMWQVSPNSPAPRLTPSASPIRRVGSGTQMSNFPNVPCLSPILGSPNKAMERDSSALVRLSSSRASNLSSSRAATVPENLSNLQEDFNTKRRSAELSYGRNVVLNYGGQSGFPTLGPHPIFERSTSLNSLTRRTSFSGKENMGPMLLPDFCPPDLSEDTLMAPEHNEILNKLKFILVLVDTIIEVARAKAAPLSVLAESMTPRNAETGELDTNSPIHRRLQQLLLHMRCLHLLSQTLDFSRAELQSKRLKPSSSVKNVIATLNERFRHCISMVKMLNSDNILAQSGLDAQSTSMTADKILYEYAIEQCQSAALDELFGNPGECFQRYHGAHVILHALQCHTQNEEDKNAVTVYKEAVEKRLSVLESEGFVRTFDTNVH